jgi:hypothetical protein
MTVFAINSSNTIDPIKTIYIPFSIADPCVFHGLLLLSAQSFAKISVDTSYRITALTHKTECIRLVNKALGVPGKATSDATIAAVLMLAVEEVSLNLWPHISRIVYEPIRTNVVLSFFWGISRYSRRI